MQSDGFNTTKQFMCDVTGTLSAHNSEVLIVFAASEKHQSRVGGDICYLLLFSHSSAKLPF